MVVAITFGAFHIGLVNNSFELPPNKRPLKLVIITGIIGFAISAYLGVFLIAVSIASLFAVYSWRVKNIPVHSTIVHFIIGFLGFLFGFSIASTPDVTAVLPGIYFGLLVSAGHLSHEVSDYDEDRGKRVTNPIRFGRLRVLGLSFAIFTLSTLYLSILCAGRIGNFILAIPLLFLYPFHCLIYLKTVKNINLINRYRQGYRIIYVSAGLFIGGYLLYSKWTG